MSGPGPRDRLRAEFDAKAPAYETNRLGGWYRAQAEHVADRLAALGASFDAVLDVGCGTGWLLRRLAAEGRCRRGIGIDLSPEMVRVATDHAEREAAAREGQLEFHVAAWPELNEELDGRLDAADIDCLVSLSALHYMPDLDAAVRRMRDVVRPGGRVAILERAPELSALTRMWGVMHASFLRDGVTFVDSGELGAALERAGFVDVEVDSVLRRWFWHGKIVTSMALTTARVPTAPRP